MRAPVAASLALMVVVLIPGCLGENRRPEERTTTVSPETAKRSGAPLYVYREIPSGTAGTTSPLRLTIETSSRIELEKGSLLVQGSLTPEESKELGALAGAVPWDKLPTEYPPARDAKHSPKNPSTYEVTYTTMRPTKTVTTHDGNDGEDEALLRFRRRLQDIARRLETAKR